MTRTGELQFARHLAQQYEERGYTAVLEPSASVLPSQLKDYRPELLVVRGGEHIIIDVKAAGARANAETYFRLNEKIRQHPGWRLLLVTAADAEPNDEASSADVNAGIGLIQARLQTIDRLMGDAALSELIFPNLWTLYVTTLRLFLMSEGQGGRECTDQSLLNLAYSTGVISFGEHEEGRHLCSLRNLAIHSLGGAGTSDECKQLRRMTAGILARLLPSHAATA